MSTRHTQMWQGSAVSCGAGEGQQTKEADAAGNITDQLGLGDVNSKLGANWRCDGKVGDHRGCCPVHLSEYEHALGPLHAWGRDECGCWAHAPFRVRRVHRYSDASESSSRDRDTPTCCPRLLLAQGERGGVVSDTIADCGAVGHEIYAAHVASSSTTGPQRIFVRQCRGGRAGGGLPHCGCQRPVALESPTSHARRKRHLRTLDINELDAHLPNFTCWHPTRRAAPRPAR